MTRHDRALARLAAALLSLVVALPVVAPAVAAASPLSVDTLVQVLDLSTTDGTALTDGTTAATDGTSITDGTVSATDGSVSPTDGTSITDGTTSITDGSSTPVDGAVSPTDGTSATDGTISATDGSGALPPDERSATDGSSVTDGTGTIDASAGVLGAIATSYAPRPAVFSAWKTYRNRSAWVRGYWRTLRAGKAVRGRASWYPSTRTWHGFAAVALPGGRYRPRGTETQFVKVCAKTRCATVPVVDYCDCYINTANSRIADLSLPLVRKLRLKRSQGIYTITIRLVPARVL